MTTHPKRVQRLMALPEVTVLRRTTAGDVELPVGTRGDYWRRVVPEVRSGRLVVEEHRDEAGIVLVFVEGQS